MMYDALGYYQILDVRPDVDNKELKLSYRDQAKRWHPDHNSEEEAKDNFQKVSVAYDVLSDENKRLTYDLLSSAYEPAKFPSMFSLKTYKNHNGEEDLNLRVISSRKVVGKIISEENKLINEICNPLEAKGFVLKTSINNWLLGWWGVKAFFLNIKALLTNFTSINKNTFENYQMAVHNALAYWQGEQSDKSFTYALIAQKYANNEQRILLDKLISILGPQKVVRPKRWNYWELKLIQLFIPLLIVAAALSSLSVKVVTESDLMSYFSKKKEIRYNQEVRLRGGGSISDDMVVGKIMNIPIDIDDLSKLYTISDNTDVMHGPSDDFDVMRTLNSGVTVRLTGKTPDNIWARIMMDDGEMGYVRMNILKEGKGKHIPFGSKIIRK